MIRSILDSLLELAQRIGSARPPDISAELRDLVKTVPPPVIWLIGKPQTGKSSIVRTLTGLSSIEIGEGYKPVTKTSSIYSFPSDEAPLIRFLDTRGILESGYDAQEDLDAHQHDAHLLLLTVRVGDFALDSLLRTVREIRRRHREWPVIVAQSCLHDSYPPGASHVLPYPFRDSDPVLPPELSDMELQLRGQRERLEELDPHFVPIDFTLPLDGLTPEDYGRDALLDALEDALPTVRWNLLREREHGKLAGKYWRAAQPHIAAYSALAGAAAGFPLPLSDAPVVAGLQLKMLHSLAGIYNQELTYERVAEVLGALGYGYLARLGWRALLKFIPGGSVAYGAYVAGTTYALGNAFCVYFGQLRDGIRPSPDELREIFSQELRAGEKLFAGQRDATRRS